MSQTYSRESDLAADVASDLKAGGWSVYAEPEIPGVPAIPDLVAVHPVIGELRVVEVKLDLSWHAVSQTAKWTDHANTAVLCVPYSAKLHADTGEGDLIRRTCRAERIGLVAFSSTDRASVIVPPIVNHNPRNIGFIDVLQTLPEYDPATAVRHPGTPGRAERPELAEGRDALVAFVSDRPGRRINRYHEQLLLHLGSGPMGNRVAAAVIADAKAGKVPGVLAVRSGGLWRLQPASEEKAA